MNDTVSKDCILRNVCAGNAVKQLLLAVPALIDEDVDEARFWETLTLAAADRCGLQVVSRSDAVIAMTDEEAMAFEQDTVPSHIPYRGTRVYDVSPAKWVRFVESPFFKKLRRYMKSRRFVVRQT